MEVTLFVHPLCGPRNNIVIYYLLNKNLNTYSFKNLYSIWIYFFLPHVVCQDPQIFAETDNRYLGHLG